MPFATKRCLQLAASLVNHNQYVESTKLDKHLVPDVYPLKQTKTVSFYVFTLRFWHCEKKSIRFFSVELI